MIGTTAQTAKFRYKFALIVQDLCHYVKLFYCICGMACSRKRERSPYLHSDSDEELEDSIFIQCPSCAHIFELQSDCEEFHYSDGEERKSSRGEGSNGRAEEGCDDSGERMDSDN